MMTKYDWGIMRTGGVFSTFYGTREEALLHVRTLNESDEHGSSEIVTDGMSREQAIEWMVDCIMR